MNEAKKIDNLFLTGADCFILALEKHNQLQGASGNTCRYILELAGKLDVDTFRKKVNQNKTIQQLASFSVSKNYFFSKPKWKINATKQIEVNTYESGLLIPTEISTKNFSNNSNLFCFDIVNQSNGNSCLIFSWHHLLLDGYGAVLLLKQLVTNSESVLSTEEPKVKFGFKNIQQAVKAKLFIDKSSKKELSGISVNAKHTSVNQKIKTIHFTEQETKQIESNAATLGAKFGVSPFYLACATRAVKQILIERKSSVANFWVPVPQSTRKKGSLSPLLSNHLSFLFYRITNADLTNLKQCVTSINNQMVNQIRNSLPKAYTLLLGFLKRIPSSIYYQLIKGPQGNSLSSFLFTMTEEHPQDLMQFEGLQVINALSIPPNNFKPGLTFACMKFNNCLQLMILSFDEVLSKKEINNLEIQMKHELITGKSFNQ